MCIWWLSNFISKTPFFDKKWNFCVITAGEYEHHQKNIVIFILSTFLFCYSTFISNEGGKRGGEDKGVRGYVFHLFFRVVFRACGSVEMCFWLIRKVRRKRKIIRALTTHLHNMLSIARKQSTKCSTYYFQQYRHVIFIQRLGNALKLTKSFIQNFIITRKVAFEDAFTWTNFKKNGFDLSSNNINENERRERFRLENALIW